MRYSIALICCLLLGACTGNVRTQLPETVTVTVEKYRDLPPWAKNVKLPNDPPADSRLGSILKANDTRAGTIDYANCLFRLLDALDRGESVSIKDCKK